jgi:hypothetical protein
MLGLSMCGLSSDNLSCDSLITPSQLLNGIELITVLRVYDAFASNAVNAAINDARREVRIVLIPDYSNQKPTWD